MPDDRLRCVTSIAALTSDLRALGVENGGLVLVHAGFREFGEVERGPDGLIQAILDAVGPSGGACFMAHNWSMRWCPEDPPQFDMAHPPISDVGIVPRYAFLRTDRERSIHPTHSVTAFGPRAASLIGDHPKSLSPCDEHSPYYKLAESGGHILLAGCDHHSNTSIHMAEEIAPADYHLMDGWADATVRHLDGHTSIHRTRIHQWGPPRQFMVLDQPFDVLGIQTKATVGRALCRLIDARRQRDAIVERMRREPHFLVAEN